MSSIPTTDGHSDAAGETDEAQAPSEAPAINQSQTPDEQPAPIQAQASSHVQAAPTHSPTTTVAAVPVESAAAADAAPASMTDAIEMASQLGGHIAPLRHRGEGEHDITVMLHPAELGAVRVNVEIREGVIGITMAAAQESSAAVLRDALPVLRQQLADAGLQLGRSDVSGSFEQMSRDLSQSSSGHNGRPGAHDSRSDARSQHLAADGFRSAASPAAQRISRTSQTQGGLDVTI